MQKNPRPLKWKNNLRKLIIHLNTKTSLFSIQEITSELRGSINVSLIPNYIGRLVKHGYLSGSGNGFYRRNKVIPQISLDGKIYS